MDAKNIGSIIIQAPKAVEKAMRDELPRKVAVISKNHFKQNFRDAGFRNGGLQAWKRTRRQEQGSEYTPLTSRRNHLMDSIDAKHAPGQVVVSNLVPYATIHNEGGTINTHPTVTPKLRKLAWAKMYSLAGVKKGEKLPKELPEEARKWRALALTKKNKLNIRANIPQRQFIGNSKELKDKINKEITKTLQKISNGITTG